MFSRALACAVVALLSTSALADEPAASPPAPTSTNGDPPAPPPSPPAPPARDPGSPPSASALPTGFDFGSYGRIGLGGDMRGHEGFSTNVVSHGSRLEKAPYLELNFYYTGLIKGDPDKRWQVVIVPALAGGDLFHYTGSFASHLGLRNAYAQSENLFAKGLRLWVGSRMLRGDDMYLFDYWPMDNLNTIGGGLFYDRAGFRLQIHAGMNQLLDTYQYETLDTPPRGLGAAGSATVLSRPRGILSMKLTKQFGALRGWKAALYGEFHGLPAGDQLDEQSRTRTPLPGDYGWVAGVQLGGWLRPGVFLNAWFRAAGGLAAYGDLTVPTSLDAKRQVTGARELVGAIYGNWESRYFGMQLGGYVRRFTDPAGGRANPQSYTEGIFGARPTVYVHDYFHAVVELSYQARTADGLDFLANRVLYPRVFRVSLKPTVNLGGRGTYSRPMLYAIYTLSLVNQDARLAKYDPIDYRYSQGVVHYLGAGVEWWFNSSYR